MKCLGNNYRETSRSREFSNFGSSFFDSFFGQRILSMCHPDAQLLPEVEK